MADGLNRYRAPGFGTSAVGQFVTEIGARKSAERRHKYAFRHQALDSVVSRYLPIRCPVEHTG
jgi:hypothetical protein